jgi:type II secretory pathway pseudopilin PulG
VLLAVLFLVALILIGLAVAAPKVAQDIQRDKETEFYHRGMHYARAIRLYYRRFGNYPTDLSQLENTNNIRFLRKRYVDPITGQPFRIIHQGEAKSMLLGLFGQPLIPGASPVGTPIGSPIAGTQNGTTTGNSPLASNADPLTTTPSGDGTTTGNPPGQPGSSTSTGFGSTTSTGSTTVIGRIVGVSSTSPKVSIRVYKKQTHYNQWEFVYNPATDGIMGGFQPGLNTSGATPVPGQGTNLLQSTGGVQTNPQQSQPTNPAPSQ